MTDHCPHCGGDLAQPAAGPVIVSYLSADGRPLPLEEATLRARAMASLLEERTGWRLAGRYER